MRVDIHDSQANLAFVRSQQQHVEPLAYEQQYPEIQYPRLVPVDTSAPEFTAAVTYVSTDGRGTAKWINGNARDIPTVGLNQAETTTQVYTAAIGYDYGWEEVGAARQLGRNLAAEKVVVARRVAEEMIDRVVLSGDTAKNFGSLINNAAVTPANVALNAAAASRLWTAKTPLEIVADINEALMDTWSVSLQVEMADTVLLSTGRLGYLATRGMSVDNPMSVLEYIMKNNLYTFKTKQPLTFEAVRGLETAGVSTTQRMVTYTRRPDIVKFHLPMAHRFLEVQIDGLYFMVPGVMRLGGIDIKRPGSFRYRDAF